MDAYDIDVADYVPTGLGAVTLVGGQTGVSANGLNGYTVDFVGAGLSTTFEVEATIAMNFQGNSLVNNAEITGGSDVDGGADATDADSTPGDNSMDPADPNDNSTGDGDGTSPQDDDFDPAEILLTQVFDLALTKVINATATPPPYAPGSVVQFTIEVFNQGTLDAYDIDVADYVLSLIHISEPTRPY